MSVNHAKEFLEFFHPEALFSELFSWTSNCSHCLSFANFLPKFGTVTPEDILLPNMSVCGWISITGLALLGIQNLVSFDLERWTTIFKAALAQAF